MNLFVFNPENDLALANNSRYFIAPASARKMRSDLQALPLWWSGEGDCVLVNEKKDFSSCALFGLGQRMALHAGDLKPDKICPWGWSPLVVTQLSQCGVSDALLPDTELLDVWRNLSGRSFAVEVLADVVSRAAQQNLQQLVRGTSFYCESTEDIDRLLRQYPGTLLKAPWSGSGKGLRLGLPELCHPLSGWCTRLLRNQGGVVVEPLYNKVCDFACEFYSDGMGQVSYQGLSVFSTTHQGAYAGNMVASEPVKRKYLEQWLPGEIIDWVCRELKAILVPKLSCVYRGPFGVDMMVCKDENGYFWLHPCVEINLRMTMGMVAVYLQHWLADGVEARFFIDYASDSKCLHERARVRRLVSPVFLDGKLQKGCMELTPLSSETNYLACLETV